ncbi:MAG: hypothetical protein DLM68_06925 [Hyphomicrobiales bacterium]|nr:MAG: hypothetical protein DLM68_06925 [Hyphomicrobiales bacterium]
MAKTFFARAAHDDYPMAMVKLGTMYYKGDGGGRKDPINARIWFQRAAKFGDDEAKGQAITALSNMCEHHDAGLRPPAKPRNYYASVVSHAKVYNRTWSADGGIFNAARPRLTLRMMAFVDVVHPKGVRSALFCSMEFQMARSSSGTLVKPPRRIRSMAIFPNQRRTRFNHDEDVGMKWSWKRLCRASQSLTSFVL